MTKYENIKKEIKDLPNELVVELDDFIKILLEKQKHTKHKKARFGSGKGIIKTTINFEDPVENFQEYLS